MTTHGALVCTIHTRPHPNSDRGLQLGQVGGFQVVVGTDVKDGDTVLFFSSELRLSPEYLTEHDLVTRYNDDGTRAPESGYFSPNGNVRAQKFRGERSDGFVMPLDSLPYRTTGTPPLGSIIEAWEGFPLCTKKVSTKQHVQGAAKRTRPAHPWFPKHVDTEQFGYFGDLIPIDSDITVTVKLHGTSGRTTLIPVEVSPKRSWIQRLLNRPAAIQIENRVFTGTRNMVVADGNGPPEEYGDAAFREAISARFADQLHVGETVYYEIVGYVPSGAPIMGAHDFSKSTDYKKDWGKTPVVYHYGQPIGTAGVYVYRITHTIPDQYGQPVPTELSDAQMRRRSRELGLDPVPLIFRQQLRNIGERANLAYYVDEHANALDQDFPWHPREGVVVRVDRPNGDTYFLKSKGHAFKVGEGIVKEQADYDDIEEAA